MLAKCISVGIAQNAELILVVKIGEKTLPVPIGNQFKEKFRSLGGWTFVHLTKKRLEKIQATMPEKIQTKEVEDPRRPHRIEDSEIDAWFERARQAK